MTIRERLSQLASALPSDASGVLISRGDILAMLAEDPGSHLTTSMRDLTVEEVAHETRRAASTIRGWLGRGELDGYLLNGRAWRVPRASLREYLEAKTTQSSETPGEVDITAWRNGGRQ